MKTLDVLTVLEAVANVGIDEVCSDGWKESIWYTFVVIASQYRAHY